MNIPKLSAIVAPTALLGLFGLSVAFASASSLAATRYEEGPQSVPMAQPARASANLVDRNKNGLSDGLEARLGALAGNDPVDVVVTYSGTGNATSAARAVGSFDVIREFTIIEGFAATMTVGQARALAGTPGVLRVEEVFELSANLQTARNDFGVDAVQLGLNGTAPLEGDGIGICIVDSGARATHIAFNDENGLRIVAFYNALTNGPTLPGASAFDDFGHGTIVAGIAAGDNRGVRHSMEWDELLRGVAPRADLYIAKALSSSGTASSPDVIEAIEWCQDQPVRVINISLGTTSSSDGLDSVSLAVNNAVIGGMVVVVAAGNTGANPFTIGSPAAAERAITVGAVADWSIGNFFHTPKGGIYPVAFSSRGPTADNRIKPDIMAPGVGIASPGFGSDEEYINASGTSMSAPFVAGAVALMLEADGGLLTHQVREILYNTAQDRGDATNGPEKDIDYGFGLIDVQAAVGTALGLAPLPQTEFPTYSTGTDEIVNSVDVSIPVSRVTVVDEDWGLNGPPVSITLLIEGAVECGLTRGRRCIGFEWRPDLDAELLDPDGAQADLSTCMLDSDTECGTADGGRQETLIVKEPPVGTTDYTLEIFIGTNDRTEGQFRYEISAGPLAVGNLIDPPITIASDNPNPNNSAPAANAQVVATNEDTNVPITLTADDADGDTLTYVVVSGPSNGSLSGAAPNLTYMPNPNYNGSDSFTFKANDGITDGNAATVSITVDAINDAPQFVSSIPDQTAVIGTEFTLDVSGNFTDVDSATLFYTIPVSNWLMISLSGVLSGTPESTNDSATVIVTASDGEFSADSNAFMITVNDTASAESVVSLANGGSTSERKNWTANVVVTVEVNGNSVSGANVTGNWSTGTLGDNCTTDGTGSCLVSESEIGKKVGSATFTVTNVVTPNWDGTKPSITVLKP